MASRKNKVELAKETLKKARVRSELKDTLYKNLIEFKSSAEPDYEITSEDHLSVTAELVGEFAK